MGCKYVPEELKRAARKEIGAASEKELSEAIANLPSGSGGLTTAKVNALDGMFKVVAYDASKDYSGAYDAFKMAFNIIDSGDEGSGDGGGTDNVKTYTFGDVQTTKPRWKIYSDDGNTALACNTTGSNYVYSTETFEKDTTVNINLIPDVSGWNDCVIGCTKISEWENITTSTSTAYFHYAKLAVAHLLVDTEYNFEYTVKAGYQIVMKFGSDNTVVPTIEVVA